MSEYEHFTKIFSMSKFNLPFPKTNYYFSHLFYTIMDLIFLNACLGGCQILKDKL